MEACIMSNYVTFEADSFPVRVLVRDQETGLPLVMSGISWEAWASRNLGGTPIAATVDVVEDGVLLVRFAPNSFSPSEYKIQVRGTRGDDVQTLQPQITVNVSKSLP